MITLDEWIKELTDYADEIKDTDKEFSSATKNDLLPLLQELKERREGELRTATKFLNKTPYEQYEHLISEFKEMWKEAKACDESLLYDDLNHFVEEIVDVQMSAETMLAILGLDEHQRREARKKVIEKNAARHYYEVDK